MVETTMPRGGGGGGDQGGWGGRAGGGRPESVEGPRAITAGEGGLGGQILHRETKMVKFNVTRIAGSEPTNRKKIVSNVRSYENVVEIERPGENRGTY
jgi:hypothetical protein